MNSHHESIGSIVCWLVIASVLTACGGADNAGGGKQSQNSFATLDEAVAKGKQDLVAALRTNQQIKLGTDAAAVERSQATAPISRVDVDFEKLLAADPKLGMAVLAKGERSKIVPLVSGREVVTTIEVSASQNRWRVIGLGAGDIVAELRSLPPAADEKSSAATVLYEVPNLQARVYAKGNGDAQVLFANYRDQFSLREPIGAEALITALKADAVAFQAQFGAVVAKQRLAR